MSEEEPAGRAGVFSEGVGPGIVYLAMRTAAAVVTRLPDPAVGALARAGGSVGWAVMGAKRAIVRKNLRRVVGDSADLDRLVKEAFQSYARYWLEFFRMGSYSRADLDRMVECRGIEVIDRAVEQGRGAMVVTGHFGFYDIGLAWVGGRGYDMTTVAEVLRPRALFDWFAAERQAKGWRVLPARPGTTALRRLREALGRGELVCLVAERDLGRRGIWVDFFGERTTFPAGPGLLAARTGAAIVAGSIRSVGRGYLLEFKEVPYELSGDEGADVKSITQLVARVIEEIVRAAPEQWHLFGPNWPSDEAHLPPRGSPRSGDPQAPGAKPAPAMPAPGPSEQEKAQG